MWARALPRGPASAFSRRCTASSVFPPCFYLLHVPSTPGCQEISLVVGLGDEVGVCVDVVHQLVLRSVELEPIGAPEPPLQVFTSGLLARTDSRHFGDLEAQTSRPGRTKPMTVDPLLDEFCSFPATPRTVRPGALLDRLLAKPSASVAVKP